MKLIAPVLLSEKQANRLLAALMCASAPLARMTSLQFLYVAFDAALRVRRKASVKREVFLKINLSKEVKP